MADTLGQVPYAATRNPFNYTKVEQIARDLTTNWLTLDEITNQLNKSEEHTSELQSH